MRENKEKGISTRHNPSVRSKASTAGITLVALVVTIIVLIILAGVSINLVIGNNGIITKAREAKENFTKAAEEEQTSLNELLAEMNAKSSGNGSSSNVEGYGLRADGKFYCDPASTIGKYNSIETRTQTGLVYDVAHFHRDDHGCLYYDEEIGEAVYGTIFYVWDRENGAWDDGEYCDVYDSSGTFLRNSHYVPAY